MAVRIRQDGRILCAAMHPPAQGDTYLDDGLHYKLSAGLGVLVTEPMYVDDGLGGHAEHGEWWWRGEEPEGAAVGRRPFHAGELSETVLNCCCEGDPWPTLRNLVRLQVALTRLALTRVAGRVRNQPRSLLRWHSRHKRGGS